VKKLIEQRALELGFDACHFTNAAAPESARKLRRWLDDGRHGQMAYLARNAHKRIDPQLVLPGAKGVIVLASTYSEDRDRNPARPAQAGRQNETRNTKHETQNRGVTARYARFADYHDVLAGPLKQLADFTTQLGVAGTRSLWYVDTGPLLERDLAQRAGLGFVGKHTNLISRRLGNWFFLSEIITTLELAPDALEKNRCGSCVRCITACPTQAITAPFQLDARRCISYLTIELKGSIPIELRPAIHNRIYGCDDCLEVCPWNKFAQEGKLMKPHARADLATPELTELLLLDDAGFKRRFAGTPMLRTKRRGLLRNVCVALGNVGDGSSLPALRRAAVDPEPLIAEHALWAIERIEFRESRPAEAGAG
jgi:epoxyqueuosine reductase